MSYQDLAEELRRDGRPVIVKTFAELVRITGRTIGVSYRNPNILKNYPSSRYLQAAQSAGYYISDVDYTPDHETMTFTHGSRPTPARPTGSGTTHKKGRRPTYIRAGYRKGPGLKYRSGDPIPSGGHSAIVDLLGVTLGRGDLVELSGSNSDIVEAGIPAGLVDIHGYAFAKGYLPLAKTLYLSKCASGPMSFPFHDPVAVKEVLEQIDKDNGTMDTKHSPRAVDSFRDFICDPANNFVARLNDPDSFKDLVEDLRSSHHGYNAKSLASKVCKYLHEYYWDHDFYFINDNVVRSVFPYYLDAYGIAHTIRTKGDVDALSYPDLYDLLEALHLTACPSLTRSKMDHILWYCYRKYWIK